MNKLVIDCNNLCYSSFYTFGELSYEEKKTGVIFGFLHQILTIAEKFKTNKFIFCWDSRKSYRKLIYSDYKGNRRKDLSDAEMRDLQLAFGQFVLLKEKVLPELGFGNIFHQVGYEADDLIASVVREGENNLMVVSTDKDLYQLLDECEIYNQKTKKIITEEKFKKEYGVEPYQWVAVKSLMGDAGDNIPGISGIGQVRALKYVKGELPKGKFLDSIVSEEGQKVIDRNTRLIYLPFRGGRKAINLTKGEDSFSKDKFVSVFVDYGFQSFTNKKMLKRWELFYGWE